MRLICGTESATPREGVEDCGRADVCDSGVARDAGRRKQRYRVCFSDDKQKGTNGKIKNDKESRLCAGGQMAEAHKGVREGYVNGAEIISALLRVDEWRGGLVTPPCAYVKSIAYSLPRKPRAAERKGWRSGYGRFSDK